jgi:RNA polymerase sigma factor (sigma-70 family)
VNPQSSASPSDGVIEEHRWFAEEVLRHDGELKSYLRGAFPSVPDVDDIVQESYLRVWKARAAQPIRSARAFLYQVARHLALDFVRRKRISPISSAGDLTDVLVIEEGPSVFDRLTNEARIALVGDAVVSLPARTRAAIMLHKLQGLPQSEVARQLGTTEKAIERQVARGIRLCEKYIRAHGIEFI